MRLLAIIQTILLGCVGNLYFYERMLYDQCKASRDHTLQVLEETVDAWKTQKTHYDKIIENQDETIKLLEKRTNNSSWQIHGGDILNGYGDGEGPSMEEIRDALLKSIAEEKKE
jgi:hypothetical protein